MKRVSLILIIMTGLLFAQCTKIDGPFRKDDKTYDIHFWTTMENQPELSLFINDEYKGALPYLDYTPECGSQHNKTILPTRVTLKSGIYEIEAKDADGNTLSSSMLKFNKRTTHLSGGCGGAEVHGKDDCMNFKFTH